MNLSSPNKISTLLKELLNKEQKALNFFFDQLSLDPFEKLVELLIDCTGMVILTGIGKSGLVAEKIAMTLTSTGTRAFFLSPTNAMHGDIGIVTPKDIFIFFSKSGESDELQLMIPFLRNKGVPLIAIVNNAASRLAKACDLSVVLPLEAELCPFDLVPTVSAITQMVFGDVLAVALMAKKNFTLVDYAKNHPAGRIGRRLTLKVKDLMVPLNKLPLCLPGDKLVDILVELSNKSCGCVLMTDGDRKLLGIFTDGDLRRSLQAHGSAALERSVDALMTKTPRTIHQEEMASQALFAMEANQQKPITVLPVLDDHLNLVGLIKMHDILQSGL